MSAWQKTPTPNLVRYGPSKTYYLRARLVGRRNAYRESLKTTNYDIARAKLSGRLAELRRQAPPRAGFAPVTLFEALRLVRAQIEADPTLKKGSKKAYLQVLRSLEPGQPCGVPVTPLPKLSETEMEAWWKRTSEYCAPARANHLFLFVRRAAKLALEHGSMVRNPIAKLRRVHIPRTRLRMIRPDEFNAFIATMRALPWPRANDFADWCEFVCYSGTRPEEANAVLWSDVLIAENRLRVTGGPEGTKNREVRYLPMNHQLLKLLERMADKRPVAPSERVLVVRHPRRAIRAACDKLNIPWLRRYDFRHLFATRCNESGVDVATFSKWLGHKDGGALAMKTYVHPHEEHEQRSAAKVKF